MESDQPGSESSGGPSEWAIVLSANSHVVRHEGSRHATSKPSCYASHPASYRPSYAAADSFARNSRDATRHSRDFLIGQDSHDFSIGLPVDLPALKGESTLKMGAIGRFGDITISSMWLALTLTLAEFVGALRAL